MAKTRGVEAVKEEGKWVWKYAGHRWDFRLEPYVRRGLWRDGVKLLGPIGIGAARLLCPDDAILFSIGYEYAADDNTGKGDAA